LEDRIKRHNTGRSKYTKTKMPWELIYSKKFDNKISALRREKEIKSWKNTVQISKLVERHD